MKKIPSAIFAISAFSLLAGCVTPPMGPMVPVRPGDGKSMRDFDADDDYCQGYADDKVAGRVSEANDRAVQRGLIGTIIGAGLGAVVGDTRGAVVGGTAGAVIGSSSGSHYDQYGVQREYDMAYAQCMASRGNDVPGWYEHRHEGQQSNDRDDDRNSGDVDRDDRHDHDYDDDDDDDRDDRGPPPPPPPHD